MAQLVIRKAEEKDVKAIEELEQVCFAIPWSYDSIYHDVVENKLAFYLVAERDDEVIGYVGVWNVVDEGHITNVAVAPAHRRNHVGDTLVEALLQVTEDMGIRRHTLEVRKSNISAIGLYKKYGFAVRGERKGYYENNSEDALIMWRETKDER